MGWGRLKRKNHWASQSKPIADRGGFTMKLMKLKFQDLSLDKPVQGNFVFMIFLKGGSQIVSTSSLTKLESTPDGRQPLNSHFRCSVNVHQYNFKKHLIKIFKFTQQ